DNRHHYFFDYNMATNKRSTIISCAGIFPLYAGMATEKEAKSVARVVRDHLLKDGGLMATNNYSGQQWDAPNGWPPLQWVAVKAFRRYQQDELAGEIKRRWLTICQNLYKSQGKLVEKYNVDNPTVSAVNGEYPLQDGFGWTNGVYMALAHEDALH